MKEPSGDSLGEQLLPEFQQVVFGASHPTPDSLHQKFFECLFSKGAAEHGSHRSHELIGSEVEVARTVSVERAGRIALNQGSVKVEEGCDPPAPGATLDALDELISGYYRCCRTCHLIPTLTFDVAGWVTLLGAIP